MKSKCFFFCGQRMIYFVYGIKKMAPKKKESKKSHIMIGWIVCMCRDVVKYEHAAAKEGGEIGAGSQEERHCRV